MTRTDVLGADAGTDKRSGYRKLRAGPADRYHEELTHEPYEVISEADFAEQWQASVDKQKAMEESDTISFDEYLALHGGR